jgi:hypothetical protein
MDTFTVEDELDCWNFCTIHGWTTKETTVPLTFGKALDTHFKNGTVSYINDLIQIDLYLPSKYDIGSHMSILILGKESTFNDVTSADCFNVQQDGTSPVIYLKW